MREYSLLAHHIFDELMRCLDTFLEQVKRMLAMFLELHWETVFRESHVGGESLLISVKCCFYYCKRLRLPVVGDGKNCYFSVSDWWNEVYWCSNHRRKPKWVSANLGRNNFHGLFTTYSAFSSLATTKPGLQIWTSQEYFGNTNLTIPLPPKLYHSVNKK